MKNILIILFLILSIFLSGCSTIPYDTTYSQTETSVGYQPNTGEKVILVTIGVAILTMYGSMFYNTSQKTPLPF